ncbi:8-oxo-dGTP diphosphatase [Azospirillum sp. B506]|uniref:NUDIX hydrolase n=1 Tax=Azospirillum sp. B506 TaxID=137721 RepID=UPI000678B9FF|nr:8-oxo-dGTP diphosphatase [Azospirillum sp. B506]
MMEINHTAMPPVLVTLVYVVRDGKMLLMKRRRPPFAGHWVAPGGKVESHESPYDGARRELQEETGLLAGALSLRGIVREVSTRPDWQWLIFLFRAHALSGAVAGDGREGELSWWAPGDLGNLLLPESDRIFLPHVLGSAPGVYHATFRYDDDLALVDVIEHPSP